MVRELKKLYQIKILSPAGLYKLAGSVFYSGINLMALLRFASKLYPGRVAVSDEHEELTYKALFTQAEQLAAALQEKYSIAEKHKVAIMCRNHAAMIRSLFSASLLGADICLLNIEMGSAQFNRLVAKIDFNLIIYDMEVSALIENSGYKGASILSYHVSEPSINGLANTQSCSLKKRRPLSKGGSIIVLSGGTTGNFKTAERKPHISNFLNPLCALLVKANLNAYKSVYIATPVYHGFGLAAAITSILLGSKIFLLPKFDAGKSCSLILQHKIEVVTLVPIMLHRMITNSPEAVNSLSCIISGGAPLNPALVKETFNKAGHKLFNLYGTSEAGFSIMATPHDLEYDMGTIGKEISGVKIKILNAENQEIKDGSVGRVAIKNNWPTTKNTNCWVEAGDLGYKDKNGYYFLCGRIDDMIISGGENVYPVTLEHALLEHPEIMDAAVIGIADAVFGQRLKAFIVPAANSNLATGELLEWLAKRVARYQMPLYIEIWAELPYTSLGKPDKKRLTLNMPEP